VQARTSERGRAALYDPRMSELAVDPRAALLAERDRLRAELAEGIVAPGPMTYGSQAAAASQVFEQQRDLALREKNEHQLAAIDAALERLDGGTYGTCVRCGRPIAPERLEALPWAAHCIDCQRIVGKGG
jgi:DnaK suppressor protein